MAGDVRYCTTTDGVTIAYRISGRGGRCFVHTPNALSAAIQLDSIPARREWCEALGERFSLVEYDSRGTGLSQRDCGDITIDTLIHDLEAVVDVVGDEPAVLFGFLAGSITAIQYAAEHPERISHFVLWPPPVLDLRSPGNTASAQLALSDWETFTGTFAHLALGRERGGQSHAYAAVIRETVNRSTWLRFMANLAEDWSEDLRGRRARGVVTPT